MFLSLIPHRKSRLTQGHRCGILGKSSASNRWRGQNPGGATVHDVASSPNVNWVSCQRTTSNHKTIRCGDTACLGRHPVQPRHATEWNDKGKQNTRLCRPTTGCWPPLDMRHSRMQQAGDSAKQPPTTARVRHGAKRSLRTYSTKAAASALASHMAGPWSFEGNKSCNMN